MVGLVWIHPSTVPFVWKRNLTRLSVVHYESDRVLLYTYVKFDANRVFLTQEEEDEITESGKYTEAYYLPFLLITELKSGKVLGFYANWTQGDTTFTPLSYVTDFHLIRAFGFYSLGYIHILGNFQKMLTSIMRSIVDSGTLANLQGGFKLKGTKIGGLNGLPR